MERDVTQEIARRVAYFEQLQARLRTDLEHLAPLITAGEAQLKEDRALRERAAQLVTRAEERVSQIKARIEQLQVTPEESERLAAMHELLEATRGGLADDIAWWDSGREYRQKAADETIERAVQVWDGVVALFGSVQSADEPTGETADEPTGETADEPTGETADEPTDEAADEPAGETVDEPTEETVDEPTDEATDEPTDETADEPAAAAKELDAATALKTDLLMTAYLLRQAAEARAGAIDVEESNSIFAEWNNLYDQAHELWEGWDLGGIYVEFEDLQNELGEAEAAADQARELFVAANMHLEASVELVEYRTGLKQSLEEQIAKIEALLAVVK